MWTQKQFAHDPYTYQIRMQLFLEDRPLIGVWIAKVNDQNSKIEKKGCYRQEISIEPDVDEEQDREIKIRYLEANVYGSFSPEIVYDDAVADRQRSDTIALEKFAQIVTQVNSSGIAALGLSLDLLLEYPGWQRVEWGTPGVKPGQMSEF
jgi:hypothetical protein